MIKNFYVKYNCKSLFDFAITGPKLRTVKFCFPDYFSHRSEIIHSVNDLGNVIYGIYKKRLALRVVLCS